MRGVRAWCTPSARRFGTRSSSSVTAWPAGSRTQSTRDWSAFRVVGARAVNSGVGARGTAAGVAVGVVAAADADGSVDAAELTAETGVAAMARNDSLPQGKTQAICSAPSPAHLLPCLSTLIVCCGLSWRSTPWWRHAAASRCWAAPRNSSACFLYIILRTPLWTADLAQTGQYILGLYTLIGDVPLWH